LRGEQSAAEAARRHGISGTSIGKYEDQLLEGPERLGAKRGLTGREAQLEAHVDELTRALARRTSSSGWQSAGGGAGVPMSSWSLFGPKRACRSADSVGSPGSTARPGIAARPASYTSRRGLRTTVSLGPQRNGLSGPSRDG